MEYYIIDAFTDVLFQGNPAGVCVTNAPLDTPLMQKIATENNLPETAFLTPAKKGYALRWFTPTKEIDLCGHGTLAAAYVVTHFISYTNNPIRFFTKSGILEADREDEAYVLSFPEIIPKKITLNPGQLAACHIQPQETLSCRDLLLVLENEAAVKAFIPDYAALQTLTPWLGVAVTAPGTNTDFVSRYFCPELKDEDPVTGSVHCSLAPYWGEKLGKSILHARQLSPRGGNLCCALEGNRVKLYGQAVLYLRGEITL